MWSMGLLYTCGIKLPKDTHVPTEAEIANGKHTHDCTAKHGYLGEAHFSS